MVLQEAPLAVVERVSAGKALGWAQVVPDLVTCPASAVQAPESEVSARGQEVLVMARVLPPSETAFQPLPLAILPLLRQSEPGARRVSVSYC